MVNFLWLFSGAEQAGSAEKANLQGPAASAAASDLVPK
jgi:hypothetical protein